jgi:hypothetical protein
MKRTPSLLSNNLEEFQLMRAIKSGLEKHHLPRPTARASLVAWALLSAVSITPCLARASSQRTFASPDEASRALVSAVQEHDERAVGKILGAGSALISSDDKAEDTLERERFVQKYQEMHRWVRESGGTTTLYIGAENWPFPIPLVSRDGVWRFDSKAGSDEIRFRRIGENEVTAIGMCDTLITAKTHPGSDNEADRLVTTLLPHLDGASKPVLFHGYYFRILSNSGGGGFTAIAYPVVYRSSGVMTFIATGNGGVSEKDLGLNTANIAGAMTTYRADATWAPAESKP